MHKPKNEKAAILAVSPAGINLPPSNYNQSTLLCSDYPERLSRSTINESGYLVFVYQEEQVFTEIEKRENDRFNRMRDYLDGRGIFA